MKFVYYKVKQTKTNLLKYFHTLLLKPPYILYNVYAHVLVQCQEPEKVSKRFQF